MVRACWVLDQSEQHRLELGTCEGTRLARLLDHGPESLRSRCRALGVVWWVGRCVGASRWR